MTTGLAETPVSGANPAAPHLLVVLHVPLQQLQLLLLLHQGRLLFLQFRTRSLRMSVSSLDMSSSWEGNRAETRDEGTHWALSCSQWRGRVSGRTGLPSLFPTVVALWMCHLTGTLVKEKYLSPHTPHALRLLPPSLTGLLSRD